VEAEAVGVEAVDEIAASTSLLLSHEPHRTSLSTCIFNAANSGQAQVAQKSRKRFDKR